MPDLKFLAIPRCKGTDTKLIAPAFGQLDAVKEISGTPTGVVIVSLVQTSVACLRILVNTTVQCFYRKDAALRT